MLFKKLYLSKSSLGKTVVCFFLTIFAAFQGCENDPKDLGINYIPSIDTTGIKFLDSQADTMNISSYTFKKYINNYLAENLLVGKYQDYDSKALIRFYNISVDYDSAEVLSAVLKFRYGGYYFKEKGGNTSFNVNKILTSLNFTSITFDSVNSSQISTESYGNFNGIVPDSSFISVTLDNKMIEDWLMYAADTAYPVKNYGLALVPTASSTTIKGFYLINNNVEFIPAIDVILSKNGVIDTISLNTSDGLSLSDAPESAIPSDRIFTQNGIAYRSIMNFDLTKLPGNVIINNATLQFTLDRANSFISENTDKRIVVGMVTDSVTKTDTLFIDAFLSDSIVYSVNLNPIVQRWNSGIYTNQGISMKNYFELQNLDNFVIFSPNDPDISKRPRLKITYTLRN